MTWLAVCLRICSFLLSVWLLIVELKYIYDYIYCIVLREGEGEREWGKEKEKEGGKERERGGGKGFLAFFQIFLQVAMQKFEVQFALE